MFRAHRSAFLEHMEEGDVALFPGASFQTRNHDVEFPFRQDSDYWYLTGHAEADGVLLLAKGVAGFEEDQLFLLPKDPAKETWTGVRLGPEGACEELGFAAAFSCEDMAEKVAEAMCGAHRIWYRLGDHPELDVLVSASFSSLRKQSRLGNHPPDALMDPTVVLHEMRLHKSSVELDWMRKSAAVSCEAHLLCMAHTSAGKGEWEIEALLNYTFRRQGADGWAYPCIVAGGANACILHYNTNHNPLQDGDLLLVDAGAEFSYYAADITRTWPVNGSFTDPQRDVYQAVLDAQTCAIEEVQPSRPFSETHQVSLRSLSESLRSLGVLKESVDEILEKELHKPWTIHNTSHWLGLDVHDAGRYMIESDPRPLEEGMVLTIEPGLYFDPNDERVPKALRGIGVRIEDDILVTGGGHEILSLAAPKTVADVEAACAADLPPAPTLDVVSSCG